MPESVDITMYIAATGHTHGTTTACRRDRAAFLGAQPSASAERANPLLNWFAAEEAEPQLTALRDAAAEHGAGGRAVIDIWRPVPGICMPRVATLVCSTAQAITRCCYLACSTRSRPPSARGASDGQPAVCENT